MQTTYDLPAGFRPESVTIGDEPVAYFGSLADGSVHRVDLVTGEGQTIFAGTGAPSAGLRIDDARRLFIAGAFAGDARVVNADSGAVLHECALAADEPALVADVVLTGDAAWFTDALTPVLYRLPFAGGQAERLLLTGDLSYVEGMNVFGIERTPDGAALLVIQFPTGILFRVDSTTGVARAVDLGGEILRGDGLLLSGGVLYVALGADNALAVVQLNAAGTRGRVVERLTDPQFDVPTAVAAYGDRLILTNSRIGSVDPTPSTAYTAVAVSRPDVR